VTTIWFWNRSVPGLIDSGREWMAILVMDIRSLMDGPEGYEVEPQAPAECFFGTVTGG